MNFNNQMKRIKPLFWGVSHWAHMLRITKDENVLGLLFFWEISTIDKHARR